MTSIYDRAAENLESASAEATAPPTLGQRVVLFVIGVVLSLTVWTGFLLVLSVIAGIDVSIWQAVAAAWLCIALANTTALASRR